MTRRRSFIVAGAAALVGAGSRRASAAAWEQQWSDLTAAAKKEGTLSVMTTVGTGYRKWIDACGPHFPGINIELQQQPNSEQICNKILAERQAGVYSFDVIIGAAVSVMPRLKPVGAVDKLRPLLFRPDVVNDKLWQHGFSNVWADSEKSYGFPLSESLVMPAINTDLVKPGELKNARSLLDPKWKGKIICGDIRSGAERVLLTSIRLADGDDAVRKFLVDQKPTFVLDLRQVTEGLVRGQYAIGHGMTAQNIKEFQDQGLGKNVKIVDIPDVSFITYTFSLWAANHAPHPNAQKLFLNWLLTKEGMQLLSSNTELNIRRTDVPPYDANAVPKPNQHYFFSSNEAGLAEVEKTRALVAQITGQPA